MFMPEISNRVVFVNGKHPMFQVIRRIILSSTSSKSMFSISRPASSGVNPEKELFYKRLQ